ncbi:SpoIIE family protein phosphatase [uncultured Thiodictyon sp.]|uniref:SpoIIE family protein phosphatase n=1 Tax=uncultured Thiodictyon sp. TaxID=1846217 RepID=UPI0025F485E9|nr:SpoIIE family protein phosphatase [uncultured Thiodictyon sp.]
MISRHLQKLPLRVTVPLLLALPILLTAVVISLIFLTHSHAATQRLAYDELAQIHREILDQTDALLSQPQRINQLNANLIRDGLLDPTRPRPWARVLLEEASTATGITGIDWASTAGDAMTVSRYVGDREYTLAIKDTYSHGLLEQFAVSPAGEIAGEPLGAVPYEPRQRPWYIAGLAAGMPAWSEPYTWIAKVGAPQETLAIAYSQPYRNPSGHVLGVLAAEVSLEEISTMLNRLQIGKTGLAFILYADGRLVARSTGTPIIDAVGRPVLAWNSADATVAAVGAFLKTTLGSLDPLNHSAQYAIAIAGHKQLIKVSPLHHATGLNWLVVTVVPQADFLADIEIGRTIAIAVAIAVVLLGLGLGTLAAKAMTAPILCLVDHVRRIGAGDLETQVALTESPELTQLSDEINAMTAGLRDRLRMRQSLAMAMDVQRNLLPQETPVIPGIEVAGHSTYCDETGGDYYDYLELFDLPKDALAVALGDVTGHGIAAAMVMATARGILRSRSRDHGSLADLLNHMNDLLIDDSDSGRFMTMLLMAIDPIRREMRWASAGHDMPFIYDPAVGHFTDVDGGGIPLGIMADRGYEEFILENIAPGTIFLAATDGIWETTNSNGEFYGKQRVAEVIRRHAGGRAEEISACLREELEAFRGDNLQTDDITLVVVKVAAV